MTLLYLFGVVIDNFIGGNIGRGNVYEEGSDSYGVLCDRNMSCVANSTILID
ncbi:MAG: hypothetical protein HEP80_05625 [Dolichospermum sp. UKL201]|nr:MAG: hypothetical protein HEP80_05625 [Dolichospermum sp. UKL201]